jgi:hypothetical protein
MCRIELDDKVSLQHVGWSIAQHPGRLPRGVLTMGAALAQGPQLIQPCPNVSGLQRLQLAPADTRHDVKADIAFICRVRCAADTRFRDVFEPVGHAFGDRQSRCRNRYPAPLLIPDFPQFVKGSPPTRARNRCCKPYKS